ncbi:MAG: glycosyltransferase family 2 protein [Candidatus Theseobacter exili]|nr:glycosyltransferase family 2 protein [Candidatus Theseobacter exili]
MRIIAILAVYNEERFIIPCLNHYIRNGIEVYLIDNESTDKTVENAEQFLDKGLIGIETLKRENVFSLRKQLKRKEELSHILDADWLLHIDADEYFVPLEKNKSLKETIKEIDNKGFNTVNFTECTFVPTIENSDHDYKDFLKTMNYYYPFCPYPSHHIRAWRKQKTPVELAWSGGHRVRFPGVNRYPKPLIMKHYIFLRNMKNEVMIRLKLKTDGMEIV